MCLYSLIEVCGSPPFPNKNPTPSQKIHKTDITELYALKSNLLKLYNGIAQFNVLGNREFCPASAFIQQLVEYKY